MKNRSLCTILAAAASMGGLLLISDAAQPQTPLRFGRSAMSEGGHVGLTYRTPKANPASPQRAPSGYSHYRLVDFGTMGGPESGLIFPAHNINNRGLVIGISETGVPDPNCYLDCYVEHAFIGLGTGRVIELPFPPGIDPVGNTSLAGDMTASGVLGGFVMNGLIDPLTDFPQLRPVVWRSNGREALDLGTFGGNSGAVNGLNHHGDVVGMALNEVAENPDFASFMNGFLPAATQSRAFVWRGGALQDLGTLGGNDAMALAINDSGTIVGISYTDTDANDTTGIPTVHPFLWQHGRLRDLGGLGGTLVTTGSLTYGPWGAVLNQVGQAIGTSTLAGDEFFHAFLWDGERMVDLGTLGGDFSEALAIDQHGSVVGRADYSSSEAYHHATLWADGAARDLGLVGPCLNSTATAISKDGDIVGGLGACTDDPDDTHYFSAFIWRNGNEMADLNSLVEPASDLHIEFATGINERGEIAGTAFLPTGELRGIMLVPQP
jgi:probable HAF family extracellular repeat protein